MLILTVLILIGLFFSGVLITLKGIDLDNDRLYNTGRIITIATVMVAGFVICMSV